jgi:hypothetical protein
MSSVTPPAGDRHEETPSPVLDHRQGGPGRRTGHRPRRRRRGCVGATDASGVAAKAAVTQANRQGPRDGDGVEAEGTAEQVRTIGMNVFHCDRCDNVVFFENTHCVHCGCVLAFLPDAARMGSLDSAGEGLWRSPRPEGPGETYRLCSNYAEHQVCNWALVASEHHRFCMSCRLTRTIPDLTALERREAWYRLETAKRRLVYTLMRMGLPVASKQDDPVRGLAFDFLGDLPGQNDAPVLTGHADGVITVNLAEANHAEREQRREQLHEPYRTVLGHLRHESGHYYWDRLLKDSTRIEKFRELFGDERKDYAQALQVYYAQGPSSAWPERFVSAYATSHPWEDWAETWAHYLHMTDTLETAAGCGLSIQPERPGEPVMRRRVLGLGPPAYFDWLMDAWLPLTYVLNNLNRALGQPDAYPFVLSPVAVEKLRFVHETVVAAGSAPSRPAVPIAQEHDRVELSC